MTAEKQRVWMGVDPGGRGSVAIVDWPGFACPFPLRDLDDSSLFELIGELIGQYEIRFAFIENVRPLPFHMRGPIAAVKLSQSFAAVKMALTGHGIPHEEIEAQAWQRALNCLNRSGDKRISRSMAVQLFPQLRITHEVADGLLIAYHCQQRARHPELLFYRPPERRHNRMSWRKIRP